MSLRTLFFRIIALVLVLASSSVTAMGLEMGVFYYPGWHSDPFSGSKDPWAPIKKFPALMPLKGWYDDSKPEVISEQVREMRIAGFSFVIFDWYFENGATRLQAPMDNFFQLTNPPISAALMWARHGKSTPTTHEEWLRVVNKWIGYAAFPSYYKIDGRPVIAIFDTGRLATEAVKSGSSLKTWIEEAQSRAAKSGLKPFYFVAGIWNDQDPVLLQIKDAGFAALTSYNYRRGPRDLRDSHNYVERDQVYRKIWPGLVKKAGGLDVLLPLTSGWDRRPWGGSDDKLTDNSSPTRTQFYEHIMHARGFAAANRIERAIVCCWNEFGEGSFVEPTKGEGDAKIRMLQRSSK